MTPAGTHRQEPGEEAGTSILQPGSEPHTGLGLFLKIKAELAGKVLNVDSFKCEIDRVIDNLWKELCRQIRKLSRLA